MARTRKKPVQIPNPTDLAISKSDVEKLANMSRLMINIIAGILAFAFAFLVFSQSQIVTLLHQSDPGLFYKVGLAVCYTAWVFGTKFDVDIEERVYIKDTARGVLDWKAFGIVVILTAVMALFFWLHRYERAFAFGLVAFILVNIAAWRVVCTRISVPIRDSEAEYIRMEDYIGAEKVRIVAAYMRGGWQKKRFATMLAIALVMVVMNLAIPYFHIAQRVAGIDVQGLPAEQLVQLAPALFFIGYVVVSEGWMWIQRINVHHCVNVMDQLATEFRLVPKTPAREPAL